MSGSGELTILVQNEGEKTLIVTITIPTAVENPLKQLKISKHQTQKVGNLFLLIFFSAAYYILGNHHLSSQCLITVQKYFAVKLKFCSINNQFVLDN